MLKKAKLVILTIIFMTMFIYGGQISQAIDTIEYVPTINLITREGQEVQLPEKINVTDDTYNLYTESVTWESIDSAIFNQSGVYEVTGTTVSGKGTTAHITVYSKEKIVNISAIGDSITYGMNVENVSINSYPKQLNYRLGSQYMVSNFGNSGKTLLEKGNDPYVRTNEYKRSLASNPDVVIIQLGTNDTKAANFAKISDFVTDYLRLIKNYQDLETKPLIYVSLPPKVFSTAYGIGQPNLEKIIPMIVEAAQKSDLDVSIINNQTETQDASTLIPDGVHPNAKGAAVIANNVYRTLTGPKELSGKISANEYTKSFGAINSLSTTGTENFYLSGISKNNWISYENVDLDDSKGSIQFMAASPVTGTDVEVRLDSLDGPVVGQGTLNKTANNTSWMMNTIPIEKVTGKHNVYLTFTHKTASATAELVRLDWIDFQYDAMKPAEAASAAELEALLASGLTTIKLTRDITLTKSIALNSDIALDLNGFTLNAVGYNLTKTENINKRINVSIFNGSVTGTNAYGTIYAANSENENYGMDITVSDINFDGVLFIRNNVKGSVVSFNGHNEIKSTRGSNVYARNITIEAGSTYYGSTQGGGGSNESGSTVFTFGTGNTDKVLTIEKEAVVELYPGSTGTSYAQNAVYGFSKIDIGEKATFIAKGKRPMLRTEYTARNAVVNAQIDSIVDLQTTEAVEGVSFSYGIDYTFDHVSYLNLESQNKNKYSFMFAYRTSSITAVGGTMSVWNKELNSNEMPPSKTWDFETFKLNNFTNNKNMGTVESDSITLKNEFGIINQYNRISVNPR